MTRSEASPFLLRYAQPYFAKMNWPTYWSLYPQGLKDQKSYLNGAYDSFLFILIVMKANNIRRLIVFSSCQRANRHFFVQLFRKRNKFVRKSFKLHSSNSWWNSLMLWNFDFYPFFVHPRRRSWHSHRVKVVRVLVHIFFIFNSVELSLPDPPRRGRDSAYVLNFVKNRQNRQKFWGGQWQTKIFGVLSPFVAFLSPF